MSSLHLTFTIAISAEMISIRKKARAQIVENYALPTIDALISLTFVPRAGSINIQAVDSVKKLKPVILAVG